MTTIRIAAALLTLSTFALGGCAAESGQESDLTSSASDEGNELGATADELATSGPTYQVGTELVTIANLNLRASPSTTATVKKVMPSGSKVTVVEESGGNGWIKISFSSYTGYGHTSYLAEAGSADEGTTQQSNDYSSRRGNTLANTADRVDGRPSGGACALEVSNSVVRSGILNGRAWRRNDAWALANNMKNDSAYQSSVGFRAKSDLTTRTAPVGSIVGWKPGQCGYNRTYGHIEIIVNNAHTACSDYCATVKTCTPGAIFIPTSL